MSIESEKDLGKALNDTQDIIEIQGSLKDKVIRIKATGKVAWVVAIGSIGVSVASIVALPMTGGTSSTANFVTAPVAVGILGSATTVSAISIAVAAGGVGALNKLRKYKITRNDANGIVLERK